jgi:hypothetical protein
MLHCWEPEAVLRPSFSDLVESISTLLEKFADYMDISAFERNANINDNDIVMEAVSMV